MPDNYAPRFQHTDWINNVDLVSADGENGFNKRFKDLRQELDAIARIIGQINSSLAPPTTTLTFAPSFSTSGNSVQWSLTEGIAAKGVNQTVAAGWLSVQLPQSSRVQSMTVIGEKAGVVGEFQVQLVRQSFSGGRTTLATLDLAAQPDSFQPLLPIPPANSRIDNLTNKYLVIASIVGAAQAATARIFAIQFICNQA